VKIFISWSGPREQAVAEALQAAIPDLCVADVDIFVSSSSITKGANGLAVIEAKLDDSAYGIVLVSRENQTAPWLNYEGGWLASTLDRPVATICLDLRPGEVTSPLAPRQATQFDDEKDMATLLRQVVDAANPSMNDRVFQTLLAQAWPGIRDSWVPATEQAAGEAPARDDNEMLAELVERVRRIEELGQHTNMRVDETLHRSLLADERRRYEASTGAQRGGTGTGTGTGTSRFERSVRSVVERESDGALTVMSARLRPQSARVVLVSSGTVPEATLDRVKNVVKEMAPSDLPTTFEVFFPADPVQQAESKDDTTTG
jgi:hypothetical protein